MGWPARRQNARHPEALDSALEQAVQLGANREQGHDEDDFGNILTPHDECQHWKLIDGGMMPAASSDQRARAPVLGRLAPPCGAARHV